MGLNTRVRFVRREARRLYPDRRTLRDHYRGNARSKANEQRDREIRALAANGMTQRDIAHACGISHQRVHQILNPKPKPRKPPKLTPEAKALLGTMPDKLLARKLGWKHSRVSYYRRKLGIARFPNTWLDLSNQPFGRLTALAPRLHNGKTMWFCECSCGKFCWVARSSLLNGQQSCGCARGRKKVNCTREGDESPPPQQGESNESHTDARTR